MNDTEKARAYDEALETARKINSGEGVAAPPGWTTCEVIFPELKESEDEESKKWILEYLYDGLQKSDEQFKGQFNSAIAWLEKVGEKTNPYSGISFEYNGHIWGMCARDNGVDILLDKQLFEHLERQSEQKPADKVESSVFKDKLLELFQRFRYIKEDVPTNGDIIDYVDAHIQELIGTIQKSAWSEEDEKRLQSCLNVLQARGIMGGTETVNTKWLKSLKDRVQPQPKQEWSEEVSPYYDDICEILINLLHSETANINKDVVQKDLDWLKSLRTQTIWKPSDEHIDTLKEAMYQVGITTPLGMKIYDLCEQLKKLREE